MLIKVKVLPGSHERKIIKKSKDEFVINTKSDPIYGKANREVKNILGNYFKVSESRIRLRRGFKRRNKIFEIIKK